MDLYPEAGSVPAVQKELRLQDLVAMLRRRRVLILIVVAISLSLATIKCIFSTRRYEANAAIQIQKDESDTLGLASALGSSESGASDALDYNITLQTQARVLTSDTLALAVIHDAQLEHNDDFTGVHAWLRMPAWFSPRQDQRAESAAIALEDAPERRRNALKTFAKRLKVTIEPGTRVINISFLSTEPAKASEVVNKLVAEFIEYNYTTRSAATTQVSLWLQGQLDGISRQAKTAQIIQSQLARQTGLFGNDEQHNVVLARLDQLTTALVAAEGNRILAEALDRVTSNGDPEAIGSISASGNASFSSGTASSFALVQQLRSRQAELAATTRFKQEKYGPHYPDVVEQQAQLESVEHSLHDEVARVAQRAHSEYSMAALAEDSVRHSLEQQKIVVEKLNSQTMEYVIAKDDADFSRGLLQDLKKKLEDAKLLSGLRSSNVTVVDPARPPSLRYPKQPNIPLTLAAGAIFGIVAGVVMAFVRDSLDMRIRSAEQVEALLGTPLLAILPSFHQPHNWTNTLPRISARARRLTSPGSERALPDILAPLDSDSTYAEVLRSLRTSLMLSQSQRHPKVILITSAQQGEGKSTTSLHLGTILGQQGGQVLIVDADLRRATLHEKLGIPNEQGLSSLLSSAEVETTPYYLVGLPNVSLLTAGPRPPYPAELLGGPRMSTLLRDWRNIYDFIIIDTPPVLPVTDAVLLSPHADIILLVVRCLVSATHNTRTAYQRLTAHGGGSSKVAVILNGVSRTSSDVTDYYGHGYEHATEKELQNAHAG